MNSFISEKKPCLVNTLQGFSIEYQHKYLYSKYNPSKNIEAVITNLEILPGTIFLCCSPVLDYGIQSLISKLKENCILIFCEFNNDLHDFIFEHSTFLNNKNVIFPSVSELYNLPVIFNEKQYVFSDQKKIISGYYKRVQRIDFSAGVQFSSPLFSQFEISCINALKTFWTNRVTLTKFGRKYSLNLFNNLSALPYTTPISNYIGKITKPIIVCGAGVSLEHGVQDFIAHKNEYFIICADTAASFLIHNNIIPDGIFIEEAQNIILKSLFDINKYDCHIFAGLSSISNLSHYIKNPENISFFNTEYVKADFLTLLSNKDYINKKNPPFGSVGLTCVYFALQFRSNDNIPVYLYGLDFSFPKAVTHVKNSIANKELFINQTKFSKLTNFRSCFDNSNIINAEKTLYTTVILQNYARSFIDTFSSAKNLFDSRSFGLPLKLSFMKPSSGNNINDKILKTHFDDSIKRDIENYILNEKNKLVELKNIFINNENRNNGKSNELINNEITSLLSIREYLYLHFIDGYQYSLSKDFLNRVRTEIDFFIKNFELILNRISN